MAVNKPVALDLDIIKGSEESKKIDVYLARYALLHVL